MYAPRSGCKRLKSGGSGGGGRPRRRRLLTELVRKRRGPLAWSGLRTQQHLSGLRQGKVILDIGQER